MTELLLVLLGMGLGASIMSMALGQHALRIQRELERIERNYKRDALTLERMLQEHESWERRYKQEVAKLRAPVSPSSNGKVIH